MSTHKSLPMEHISSAKHRENPEAEVEEESLRFSKSLQELNGLQSQLRDAADYCETTFSESPVKREVLKNTKEYVCKAMVTVVDHLGNVSTNLESLVPQTIMFFEAQLCINCLKQHQPMRDQAVKKDSGNEVPSKIKDMLLLEEEDLPPFMYTQKPCPDFKLTTASAKGQPNLALYAVPVQDVLTVLTKIPNQNFHFQMNHKAGRHRKSLLNTDMLWLIRTRKHSQ